ncbi:N-acyl-D-amino-acid deacylase family protein [Emergencia sp.]|uniref:N-acyl-D-amino-acid deacylase family protein n=1 Tax=Emergencia sp. TaxID=1926557 RepID=UPI003AEFFF7D
MFDIVIKNGLICDGTGGPIYLADMGITGDVITYIGEIPLADEVGEDCKVIDAAGKTVTPGFIDPHTHVDQSILTAPTMEPYLKQGVTTVVTGNCGYGMAPQGEEVFYCSDLDQEFLNLAGADPFALLSLLFDREKAADAYEKRYGVRLDWRSFDEFNQKCDSLPLGGNLAPLIGYSAVRTAVMGRDCQRQATENEIAALESVIQDCMEAGAFGISTGRDPMYIPGPFASDDEMNRMLQIVARYEGIFASHTFNCNGLGQPDRLGGYAEMVRQAEETAIKMNISHVHVMNMAEDAAGAVKAARKTLDYFKGLAASGVDLSYDVIPSAACSDYTLTSCGYYLSPLVLLAGTRKKLGELFQQKAFRRRVHEIVKKGKMPILDENSDTCWLGELLITKHVNPAYVGQYLHHCAEKRGLSPLDELMAVFAEDPDMTADLTAPDFQQSVDLLCSSEIAMPCSDGSSYSKDTNLSGNAEIEIYPNSMNISYIPRYLNRYGKKDFAKAVYQASGFVAQRFGIEKRGVIKEGSFADLVIMDRTLLHSFDEAENPLQDPEGILYVLVNGQIALENNILIEKAAGRVLRKK